MKNVLKCLLFFLSISFFLTSCQKEFIETNNQANSQELLLKAAAESYAKFKEEGKEIKIEYTSLEKLNEVYIENGLQPITLEDIGVTEEEYQLAQEQINDSEYIQPRCNAWYWYLGDMNGNGNVSAIDLSLAMSVIRGQTSPSWRSENFGTISYWWASSNPYLSSFDVSIMNQMILNVITC